MPGVATAVLLPLVLPEPSGRSLEEIAGHHDAMPATADAVLTDGAASAAAESPAA